MKPNKQSSILVLLLCLIAVIAVNQSVRAETEPTDTIKKEQEALKKDVEKLEKTKTLEGHIKGEMVSTETVLKDLRKSLSHFKKTTYDIFTEVRRQDLVVVGEPNVIGPMIVPAIPDGSGVLNTGTYLPPRKKWLDYYMIQLEKLFPMVEKEVNAIRLPEVATPKAHEALKDMKTNLIKLVPEVEAMDKLTIGPKYDSDKIAKQSAVLENCIDAINKTRKTIMKEMKIEEKIVRRQERAAEKQIKREKRELKKEQRRIQKEKQREARQKENAAKRKG